MFLILSFFNLVEITNNLFGDAEFSLYLCIQNHTNMKKLLLTTSAVAVLCAGAMAQQKKNKPNINGNLSITETEKTAAEKARRCGTQTPSKKWDEAFNKMVEDHKQDLLTGRATSTTYTIPVVFHIIYNTGEAVGTGHNISQAQVNSQIPILNADYNGTGQYASGYASLTSDGHPAFYDYAAAPTNSVSPSSIASNGSIAIGSSGITFCLAQKNPSGTTLTEPGIDRVAWSTISGAQDPATASSLQSDFDNTIKPATIWDPTKYFNVWVSDGGSSGLLGYATFPPASGSSTSGITPNWGESNSATPTSADGVWVNYTAVGNTGAAAAPYNLGRTLTHESGHWLGLRHIWGDGTCLTDYCNDTPPAAAANFVNCGTAYPYHSGTCTGNSPDGEMFMNFMDYSNDCAMYMFTTDQVNRFHAALSASPLRSGLTASAANLCNVTVSTPTAAFTPPTGICANVAASFNDGSSGPPTAWNWSVSPSTGVTITTNTVSNPTITFATAGTYTVTDAVSNSAGSSSVSHTVSVTSCSLTACDTLSNFLSSDTLTVYKLPSDTGYVSGNNIYGDLAKAEFHNGATLAGTQITGVIALFFKSGALGTKGTSTVTMNIMNGTSTGGPTGTAIGTATASLSTISAITPVNHVGYCGNPGLSFTNPIIIPYKFALPTPVSTPTVGFFTSLVLPTTTGDTAVVFQNTSHTTSTTNTAWELNAPSPGTWGAVKTDWGFTNGMSFAILPIVCPSGSGIENHNSIANNIAMFPNPSNGLFNIATTLPEATDLTFNVVNTLGQTVYTKLERNVTNNVITLDLSDKAKGVYYISIVSEKSSAVLKAIVK